MCNQQLYKTKCQIKQYIYINSNEIKNTITQWSFSHALRGCLMVVPMKDIFDKQLVVYESYWLLTTCNHETNYILHAKQEIWMLSFSYITCYLKNNHSPTIEDKCCYWQIFKGVHPLSPKSNPIPIYTFLVGPREAPWKDVTIDL